MADLSAQSLERIILKDIGDLLKSPQFQAATKDALKIAADIIVADLREQAKERSALYRREVVSKIPSRMRVTRARATLPRAVSSRARGDSRVITWNYKIIPMRTALWISRDFRQRHGTLQNFAQVSLKESITLKEQVALQKFNEQLQRRLKG